MNKKIQNLKKYTNPKDFRGKSPFVVQLWWVCQAILFNSSPQFAYAWRRFLLRLFGAKIGKKVILRPSLKVTYPWKVEIGDYSWVGDDVVLYSLGNITIGSNCVVSQRSYLCTGSHDYNVETFDIFADPIVLEDEVWVATDVYIAPGVTIGQYTVVGARSSVFKDLPSSMICVGNPAKPIRERCSS